MGNLKHKTNDSQNVLFWLLVLTALAGVGAYLKMFTGFSLHDDEGALMLSVKQYLGGMKIYQEVFSIYGPVYYLYSALIRTLTATPVTHDITRMSSLFPWLGCALLCAWITLRLTGSLLLSATTHLLVSLDMVFFRAEPGHPQADGPRSARTGRDSRPRERIASLCGRELPERQLVVGKIGLHHYRAVHLAQ